ncbi:MAG: holin family protein [Rhodobacteraceae bacterium]|nr:holin family protein [Paracoccaceae bacterium]
MGVIDAILGAGGVKAAGEAVAGAAEVFVPNATKRMQAAHEAWMGAMDQFGDEFRYGRVGWFDAAVNGLNRLPRPFLAFGTLGLFVYAMVDPAGFSVRMRGLDEVPEPLWWLLAAIVGFYFGAREAHYFRSRAPRGSAAAATPQAAAADEPNAALDEWRAGRGG